MNFEGLGTTAYRVKARIPASIPSGRPEILTKAGAGLTLKSWQGPSVAISPRILENLLGPFWDEILRWGSRCHPHESGWHEAWRPGGDHCPNTQTDQVVMFVVVFHIFQCDIYIYVHWSVSQSATNSRLFAHSVLVIKAFHHRGQGLTRRFSPCFRTSVGEKPNVHPPLPTQMGILIICHCQGPKIEPVFMFFSANLPLNLDVFGRFTNQQLPAGSSTCPHPEAKEKPNGKNCWLAGLKSVHVQVSTS